MKSLSVSKKSGKTKENVRRMKHLILHNFLEADVTEDVFRGSSITTKAIVVPTFGFISRFGGVG